MYDGKSSPNQHTYYFRSQTGNVIDNDAIMARLFISILKGIAFDWFRSLFSGSIYSWVDLQTRFLYRFFEDDTEVALEKLFSTVQKGGESVRDNIEKFHNIFSYVPYRHAFAHVTPTCKRNFLDKIKVRMEVVKAHTWKEHVEQAKIAEKWAKNFEPSMPKNKWGVNKERDAA